MTLPLSRRRDQDEGSIDLSPPRTWETDLRDVRCRFNHAIKYSIMFEFFEGRNAPEGHMYVTCHTCGKRDIEKTTYQFGVVSRRKVHWYAFPDYATWDRITDIVEAGKKRGETLSADKVVALIGQAWNKPNDL